jgi:hypothetical protein
MESCVLRAAGEGKVSGATRSGSVYPQISHAARSDCDGLDLAALSNS